MTGRRHVRREQVHTVRREVVTDISTSAGTMFGSSYYLPLCRFAPFFWRKVSGGGELCGDEGQFAPEIEPKHTPIEEVAAAAKDWWRRHNLETSRAAREKNKEKHYTTCSVHRLPTA